MSWRAERQRKHAAKIRREYEMMLYSELRAEHGRQLWIPLSRFLTFKPLPNGIAGSRVWIHRYL